MNDSKSLPRRAGAAVRRVLIRTCPGLYTRLRYCLYYRKIPNFKNPSTYTEKLFSFILFNRNPVYTVCADKVKVRDYLKGKIPDAEKYFPRHYFVTDDPDSIAYERLPQKFVLKSNHASGHILLCENKSEFDLTKAKALMKKWLRQNYYYKLGEYQYKNIKPLIICEELLDADIIDYRVFCFGGVPYYIRVTQHAEGGRYAIATYDTQWKPLDLLCVPDLAFSAEKPAHLEEMLQFSAQASKEFPFVRVDLYDTPSGVYFAELTFTPNAGYSKFRNMKWDAVLGEKIPGDLKT